MKKGLFMAAALLLLICAETKASDHPSGDEILNYAKLAKDFQSFEEEVKEKCDFQFVWPVCDTSKEKNKSLSFDQKIGGTSFWEQLLKTTSISFLEQNQTKMDKKAVLIHQVIVTDSYIYKVAESKGITFKLTLDRLTKEHYKIEQNADGK